MALTELLRSLEDEARQRIAGILAAARSDAERLGEERAAEQAGRRAAALAVREAELRREAARALESARRSAAARVLEARAEALARVRAGAAARLTARGADAALLPMLRRDLRDGLGYLGGVPAVVEADPALVDGLRDGANGPCPPTFVPRAGGGLVLRSADGALTVDASFASRLERHWPALAIEVARRLEECL